MYYAKVLMLPVLMLFLTDFIYANSENLSARTELIEYAAHHDPRLKVDVIGGNNGAIAFDAGCPIYFALLDGQDIKVRSWGSKRLWKLRLNGGKSIYSERVKVSSVNATSDKIELQYNNIDNLAIDVTVTLSWKEKRNCFLGTFALENNSKKEEIEFFDFPDGFSASTGIDGWFVCPMWLGTSIPATNKLKDFTMVYPGHLFMQWIGLMQPGNSWLIHTEDTQGYTKFLSIKKEISKQRLDLIFGHNVLVGPGKKYKCPYNTVISFLPDKADWNTMVGIYGSWARKQWWTVPLTKKLEDRPQIESLKLGWSWLRGIPPIRETKGEKQVCMNYDDAIEYMNLFESRYGFKPMFWYTGWYDQFDDRLGEYFPVHPDMGDFKKFGKAVKDSNYFVNLHINGFLRHPKNKNFDIKRMARWKGKKYTHPLPHIGKGTINYGASPLAILPSDLQQIERMANEGSATGIYLDVLGHAFAHDDNPNVKYPHKVDIGRNNWMVQKIEYYKGIRNKFPELFIQTEGGNELLLGSVDCFSGGGMPEYMGMGREPIPLQLMVYGDCEIFLPLFDGMGQAYNHKGWRWNGLWGTSIQYPRRLQDVPSGGHWLYLMRRQTVVAEVMGERILGYYVKPDSKVTTWTNGISIWNTSGVRDITENSGIGRVLIRAAAKNDVVLVTSKGHCAASGAKSVSINDGPIYESSNPAIGFVLDDKKLMLSNLTNAPQNARIILSADAFDGILIKKARPFGHAEVIPTEKIGGKIEFEAKLLPFSCVDYMCVTKSEAIAYLTRSALQYLCYLRGDYIPLKHDMQADDPKDVLQKLRLAISEDKVVSESSPVLMMDINLPIATPAVNISTRAVIDKKEYLLDGYFSYVDSRACFGVHQTLAVDLSAFAGKDITLILEARSGNIKSYLSRRVLNNVRIVDAANKFAVIKSFPEVGFISKDKPLKNNTFEWSVDYHVSGEARIKPLKGYVEALNFLTK